MKKIYALLVLLLLTHQMFAQNTSRIVDDKRLVHPELTRKVADIHCESTFGKMQFYDMVSYKDIDGERSCDVYIYTNTTKWNSRNQILLDSIAYYRSQLLKYTDSIKNIYSFSFENTSEKAGLYRRYRDIYLKLSCRPDEFVSIYTSASKNHKPIMQYKRGLPESYVINYDIKSHHHLSSSDIDFYYFGTGNTLYSYTTNNITSDIYHTDLTDKKISKQKSVNMQCYNNRGFETKKANEVDLIWDNVDQYNIQYLKTKNTRANHTISDVPYFNQHDWDGLLGNGVDFGGGSCVVMSAASLFGYYDQQGYWSLCPFAWYTGEDENHAGFNYYDGVSKVVNHPHFGQIDLTYGPFTMLFDIAEDVGFNYEEGGTMSNCDDEAAPLNYSNYSNNRKGLAFEYDFESGSCAFSSHAHNYSEIKAEISANRPMILSKLQYYSWSSSGGPYLLQSTEFAHTVILIGFEENSIFGTNAIGVYTNGVNDDYDVVWWDYDQIELDNLYEGTLKVTPNGNMGTWIDAPTLISPSGDEYVGDVTIQWEDVGAQLYKVEVSEYSDFYSTIYSFTTTSTSAVREFNQTGWPYYIRIAPMNSEGNYCHYSSVYQFEVIDPSGIAVSSTLTPTTAVANSVINVSGSAVYNSNNPVTNGTVTISTSEDSYTTTLDNNGNFSRNINAPLSSGNITTSVSDGTLTGYDSDYITIQNGQSASGYVHEYSYIYNSDLNQESPPFPESFTHWIRSDDEAVDMYTLLLDLHVPVQVKYEWYKPDGSQYGNDLVFDWTDDPGENSYYDWWTFPWGFYVEDHSMAGIPGRYNVEVHIREEGESYDYIDSDWFVVSYDYQENQMCKDVQSSDPYGPINPTNTFYQTDGKAVTWAKYADISEEVNVKIEWYEPDGSINTENTYNLDDPGQGYYFEETQQWNSLYINGHEAEDLCGQWQVKIYEKDPSNNWDLLYQDNFQILESPNIAPVIEVSNSPVFPVSSDNISLNVTGSDNTLIEKVILYWNDGTEHSFEWTDIYENSFEENYSIGSFAVGQTVSYYAKIFDSSGNQYQSNNHTFTVTSPTDYCNAGSSSEYEYIDTVLFGNISNISTGYGENGYQDFTSFSTLVIPDNTYPINISLGNGYSTDIVKIWIDFNNDFAFDEESEMVFESEMGVGPYTGYIFIPSDASIGNTRMRVRLYGSDLGPNSTPCLDSDYGEVEDYTINISEYNDNCESAFLLDVNTQCQTETYSNEGASDSGVEDPGCANYNGGDVWFKCVIPSSGNIVVETSLEGITDTGLALYTGDCNELNFVECDDDDGDGYASKIEAIGLTPGDYAYIRVWEWQGNVEGTFGICVYEGETEPLEVSPTTILLSSEANANDYFNVSSNVSWDVSDNASWLSCSPTSGTHDGSVTVTADSENTSTSSRSAIITISGGGQTETVTVTQVGESPSMYSVTLLSNPITGGTTMGSGTYEVGEYCTASAIANEGYVFVNWTENGTYLNNYEEFIFTVSYNRTLTANFIPIEEYCDAGANNYQVFEYIDEVSINNITNNNSGGSSYSNFSNLVIDLPIEVTSYMSVRILDAFDEDQIIVWIDWNQDFDFIDNDEIIYIYEAFETTESYDVIIPIEPPSHAHMGITRMRIRLHDTIHTPNSTPCGMSDYGEVEDYSVNILSNPVEVESNFLLNAYDIAVYPNPVSNKIFIETKIEVNSISIFNELGQAVITQDMNNTSEIAVSNLQPGVYVLNAYGIKDELLGKFKVVKK